MTRGVGDSESLGSKQIDHQQSYPGGGAGAAYVASALPDSGSYFCRGCGTRLPSGFRGHFHERCLRTDKRRRIQARRAQERQRYSKWLRRAICPHCGLTYGNSDVAQRRECPREASQGPQEEQIATGWP
jgi:hypothetical protein